MKNISVIIFFLVISVLSGYAQNKQTADSSFVRPLKEVLVDIESQFGISIKYDDKLIEGKILKHADWRIHPWSVEESLYNVLAPFDYTFVRDNERYKIKEYEYARKAPEFGKKFLEYLELMYTDKSEWEQRKLELKQCLIQSLRFSELTKSPDSEIIITNKRRYDGYTVENFALETLSGIYVFGSIYKPSQLKKKNPIMLNPNGHFGNGRYREDQQYRCATQARLGIISVSWDLFAWGESLLQFDSTMHRLSAAQSVQTLNTIRILDYLLNLKYADSNRVGITGGSGGGSMAMMVSAIDDRIKLSIPVVMLSSHFVGGCPCESGMPTHLCGNRTNNAELAAMFAPNPQLIISDGKDWSSSVPELEYPFIQRTYDFYDAVDLVQNIHFENEGHDYGFSKRNAMYRFVAKHFNLDLNKILDSEGNIDESSVVIEKEEQMRVFGRDKDAIKLPKNMIKGKDSFIKRMKEVGIYD
ncbi:MAG: acetylxylan esterase [Bacteroidales bacterium]|nr:acetylxylan esterase [Bacteroidales bacterium]